MVRSEVRWPPIRTITDVQKIEQKIRARLAEKGFFAEYDFQISHKSVSIMESVDQYRCSTAQYDSTVLILALPAWA